MQDAFWNNVHNTSLLGLAALDGILNILQQIIGQDLKKSVVHFVRMCTMRCKRTSCDFVFVDNVTD